MSEDLGVLATQVILKSAASAPSKKGRLELQKKHTDMLKGFFVQFNHTTSSFQDGESFVTFLRLVTKALDNAGVEHTSDKPYGLMTDGHKSRFNIIAMRQAKELNISLYFLPPHVTTIYQPLDKVFDAWHKLYSGKLKAWRNGEQVCTGSVHKPIPSKPVGVGFVIELIVQGWLTDKEKVFAFEQCGIPMDGFDPDRIDKSQMMPEVKTVSPKKARFIGGPPALPVTPAKATTESNVEFLKKRGCFWKGFASGVVSEPMSMRDCGALKLPTDGKEKFIPGEKKESKATFYGDIDSSMILEAKEQQEKEETELEEKADLNRNRPGSMALGTYEVHAEPCNEDENGACCRFHKAEQDIVRQKR
jgi:hypothetical protein